MRIVKPTTSTNPGDGEVQLLLTMESLARPWKWLRFLAYLLGPASMVKFIVCDPVAKQGSGIACFFAFPWLLGHALRVLGEP
jgi:hypothetical protein